MGPTIARRRLFRDGGLLGLGLMAGGVARAAAIVTPPQTEGPFYPVKDQRDKDVDLTLVDGSSTRALGYPEKAVVVKGSVRAADGRPLSGAFIDIWQACENGKYDHRLDPNPAAADPNFQYWARLATDNKGEFSFTTIMPGAYPATATWMRPPHIHIRVDAFGFGRLTTQMYFKGQALNASDEILVDTERKYGRAARNSLIVEFVRRDGTAFPEGRFDIVLGTTPATE